MQNENRQNPQTFSAQEAGTVGTGEGKSNSPAPDQNQLQHVLQIRDWVQQARTEAERARVISEQTRENLKDLAYEVQDRGRSSRRTGWTAAILTVAFLGACAYGFIRLQGHESLLAQYPALRTTVNAVGERMNAAEQKLLAWSSDWQAMTARVSKIENNATANLHAAKEFAQEQAAKVHHEVQAEMDNRTRSMESNLRSLEATHEQDQKQIAQLQQDIAAARSETGNQLARSRQETGRELGNLRGEINRNRDDFDTVARSLERHRLPLDTK